MNQASVIARLKQFEGCVNYMYKCTGGEVTIGIGHALQTAADAARLSWQINSAPASAERVRSDYEAVAATPKGPVAGAYAHLTLCRMAVEDADKLVAADVQSFESQLVVSGGCRLASLQLAAALPKWNTYAEPAQEALFDMAFNLGLGGLKKFPHMLRAVDAGDWATAAAQCHREGISEERNRATAALFLQAGASPGAGAAQTS